MFKLKVVLIVTDDYNNTVDYKGYAHSSRAPLSTTQTFIEGASMTKAHDTMNQLFAVIKTMKEMQS